MRPTGAALRRSNLFARTLRLVCAPVVQPVHALPRWPYISDQTLRLVCAEVVQPVRAARRCASRTLRWSNLSFPVLSVYSCDSERESFPPPSQLLSLLSSA